jgi:cytoskeletal protein CcmA (bactofilin family)
MALFGKEKDTNSMESHGGPTPDQINLVGDGTVFEGTLRAESDVRISGRIVGRLEVNGKAIVAEGGVVDGEVAATSADIAGRVDGELHIEERLVLKGSARIDGDIDTARLVVEEGAEFSGQCTMGAGSSPASEVKKKAASNGAVADEKPAKKSSSAKKKAPSGKGAATS